MDAKRPAVQDHYPAEVAHCFGCGPLNEQGHRIKTHWFDGEGLARFRPAPHHLSIVGFAYGGLIASLIDCHAVGTAAAYALEASGGQVGLDETPRFVTASLSVQFLKPTPIGLELELRATIREASERKAIVDVELSAAGVVTATGAVVAVPMPETMAGGGSVHVEANEPLL